MDGTDQQTVPAPAPPTVNFMAAQNAPTAPNAFSTLGDPLQPAQQQAQAAFTPQPQPVQAPPPAPPQPAPEPPGPATQAPATDPGAYQVQGGGGMGPTRMPAFQALPLIQQTEDASGDPAAMNFVNDPEHTAGGLYQITDTNWKKYAPLANIDTNTYPSAVSTSVLGPTQAKKMQSAVATLMYNKEGFAPWAPFNPQLRKLINWQGEVRDPVTGALMQGGQAAPGAQPGGYGGFMGQFAQNDAATIAKLQQVTGLEGEQLQNLIRVSGDTTDEAVKNIEQAIKETRAQQAVADYNRKQQADTQMAAAQELQSDDQKLMNYAQRTPTRQAAYANVMHLTPILSILAAIGGKAMHVSALGMLAATNGIIEGVNKGAENQFADAVDKWQAQYNALKDHLNNMQAVYKNMYDAYGGRADAAEKAIEHTRNILGDQLTEGQLKMGNAQTLWNATFQYGNQLANNALTFQKIKEAALTRAMTNMGMLDPRIMQITGAMALAGVRFPPGFSKNSQMMALEGAMMAHPDWSDDQFVQYIQSGMYEREYRTNLARRAGVRAAAIYQSSTLLVKKNGSFDKLDKAAKVFQQYANAHGLGTDQMNAQIEEGLSTFKKYGFHGVYTSPQLQAFITMAMETRQELSRALQGGGQAVTEADARANAELPIDKGYDALHAGIMTSMEMIQNAIEGQQTVLDAIKGGTDFRQFAQSQGWSEVPVPPADGWVPPTTLMEQGAMPSSGIYGAAPGYTPPSAGPGGVVQDKNGNFRPNPDGSYTNTDTGTTWIPQNGKWVQKR